MTQVKAAPSLHQSRAGRANRPNYAVLIEVPELSGRRNPAGATWSNPKHRVEIEGRSTGRLHPPRRTRRRLKREVKIAACILLSCLPLAYHASSVWSNRLGNIAATDLTRTGNPDDGREGSGLGPALAREVSRSVFEPAVVLMSIEPTPNGTKPPAKPPVIFPGYLLPEDSLEEMAHEGS